MGSLEQEEEEGTTKAKYEEEEQEEEEEEETEGLMTCLVVPFDNRLCDDLKDLVLTGVHSNDAIKAKLVANGEAQGDAKGQQIA